jgi:hypothetical protein
MISKEFKKTCGKYDALSWYLSAGTKESNNKAQPG